MFGFKKAIMIEAENALAGRNQAIPTAQTHFVNGNALKPPFEDGLETAMFGLGCFWGAERIFWQAVGVRVTAAGYAAGFTPNPTYDEICTGQTGHNEVVFMVFDPAVTSYAELLKLFFESHDPTQGMRQGNDMGTQYRSGIYTYSDAQTKLALEARDMFQAELAQNSIIGDITTEIIPAPEFYYAEEYHQQYLAKNPNGYCGLGGIGISCPIPSHTLEQDQE